MGFWNVFDSISRTKSFTIGNHRLILNGRATIGPNFPYLLCMMVALGFLVLVILDVFANRIISQIIFLVFVKIEYMLLIGVGCTEPGIVPRRSGSDSSSSPTTHSANPAPSIETIVNGVKIDRKWCYTCNLYRPSRGKHCALCNCCIDKFDHHCVWLSNCIAERNYRKFFFLISNSMCLSLFVLVSLTLGSFEGWKAWLALLASFVLSLITGNLFIYHLKLILRGSTSYEITKGNLGNESNPFSLGDWRVNLNAFLTRPTDPSQVAIIDTTTPTTKQSNWKRSHAREDEMTTLTTNEFGVEDSGIP